MMAINSQAVLTHRSTANTSLVTVKGTEGLVLQTQSSLHCQGISSSPICRAMQAGLWLGIKNFTGVAMDRNEGSWKLLEKLAFQRQGYLPRGLDFNGKGYGEFYYGKRNVDLADPILIFAGKIIYRIKRQRKGWR